MRRVHVNDHEAVGILCEHVNAMQLRDRETQRRDFIVAALCHEFGRTRQQRLRESSGYGGFIASIDTAIRRQRLGHPQAKSGLLRWHQCRCARHTEYWRRNRARLPGTRLRQGFVQASKQKIMDQAMLAKSHLGLGRMGVHINQQWIEFEEQHEGRMATMKQYVGISLTHRMGDHAITH